MKPFRRLIERGLLTVSAPCLLSASAAAQSVVVDGVGADERAALIDASRTAVEQVAGTFIDSRTLVENAAVKLDQIYTKAQGFVTGTEILAKEQQGGFVHLRARIDVDTSPDAQLMNNLSMVMMLNDPRIAVAVREADGGHDRAAESALDSKLLELGFSHVVASERTVIRAATGEVVGTFTTTAKGVGTSEAMARSKAVEKASAKAAERLEEKFRHLGSEAGTHEW